MIILTNKKQKIENVQFFHVLNQF